MNKVKSWFVPWFLLGCIWGFSFLFIKYGLESFSGIQIAFLRVFIGALTVLFIVLITKTTLPKKKRVWLHSNIVALFANTIPFSLISWAETKITSVVAGMLNALTPAWALLFSLFLIPAEKVIFQKILGLFFATFGIVIFTGIWENSISGTLLGILAMIVATACYGLAVVWTKKFLIVQNEKTLSLVATQLISSTLQLAILTLLFTSFPESISGKSTFGIIFLGIFATGIAFTLHFRVIQIAGALISSTVTYLAVITSSLAGVLILREKIHWYEPIGAILILFGITLIQNIATFSKNT